MAIAFVNAASTSVTSASSVTINKPSGVVDGDILLAAIYFEGTRNVSTRPSGWNLIGQSHTEATATRYQSIYWKRASSEGSSYQWTLDGTGLVGGGIVAYSGCYALGIPVEAAKFGSEAASSTSFGLTEIATVTDNAMLVMFGLVKGSGVTADASTATSPLTNNERYDIYGGIAYDGIQATAGASGNKGVTLSASDYWCGCLLALTPAGSYGPWTDSFTDSNGTQLTTHSTRWNYSSDYNSLTINTNRVPGSPSGMNWYVAPVSDNQYAQVKVTALGSSTGDIDVGVRAGGSGHSGFNGWYEQGNEAGYWLDLIWTGGQRQLQLFKRWNNGGTMTWTQLGSDVPVTAAVNDILRIEANGTTIRGLLNGVEKISVTDSMHATGFPGLSLWDATEHADDWEGGSLTTAQFAYPIADR